MTSSILFLTALFALRLTVFASPVFDSNWHSWNKVLSWSWIVHKKFQYAGVKRCSYILTKCEWRMVRLQSVLSGNKAGDYSEVPIGRCEPPDWTSWQRGNRENLHGWVVAQIELVVVGDNKGTNRAENLLKRFFRQCELSPCWELNYSKQSPTNRRIIYLLHSTKPFDLGSCTRVENKLKLWGVNPTWILMAIVPLSKQNGVTFHWMLYPMHGFFIKMHGCHCYKTGLLCLDVCGTCHLLFLKLIRGGRRRSKISSYSRER